jgi:hypothetical protein
LFLHAWPIRVWAHLEELVDEWEQRYFGVLSLVVLRIEFQEISEALGSACSRKAWKRVVTINSPAQLIASSSLSIRSQPRHSPEPPCLTRAICVSSNGNPGIKTLQSLHSNSLAPLLFESKAVDGLPCLTGYSSLINSGPGPVEHCIVIERVFLRSCMAVGNLAKFSKQVVHVTLNWGKRPSSAPFRAGGV